MDTRARSKSTATCSTSGRTSSSPRIPRSERLIRDLLGDNFVAQSREAYIYHHAHDLYTRFPFQAHLHGLPTPFVLDCLSGLVAAVERHARGRLPAPATTRSGCVATFGDGIAEHLMIPYARKVWTVEPAEMDFAWIERRVPTPDVERIIAGALSDDVEQVGATAHFWYPKRGGIEALPRALGEPCPQRSARARGTSGSSSASDGSSSATVSAVAFDRMIYTLPLSSLALAGAGASRRACAERATGCVTRGSAASISASTARTSPTSTGCTSTRRGSRSTGCRFPANFTPVERAAGKELDLDGDRVLGRPPARPRARSSTRPCEALDEGRNPASRRSRRARPHGGDPARLRHLRPRPRSERRR